MSLKEECESYIQWCNANNLNKNDLLSLNKYLSTVNSDQQDKQKVGSTMEN